MSLTQVNWDKEVVTNSLHDVHPALFREMVESFYSKKEAKANGTKMPDFLLFLDNVHQEEEFRNELANFYMTELKEDNKMPREWKFVPADFVMKGTLIKTATAAKAGKAGKAKPGVVRGFRIDKVSNRTLIACPAV